MTIILEFLSGLLDGFGLVALAAGVGGIAYALFVLRPVEDFSTARATAFRWSLNAAAGGLVAVAVIRLAQLALKPFALADIMGADAIVAFTKTQVFQSGILSVVLGISVAAAVLWLRSGVDRRERWAIVLLATALFMVNEAWLSHAASRIEGAGPLMAVTVVHMLGATVWAGGVIHLLLFWGLSRRRQELVALWPTLVANFSPVGVASVTLVVVPGLYLGWRYVGDVGGLIGTGYGNMLVVKMLLLAFVLVLAALNFFAARAWRRTGVQVTLTQRAPGYIEVEVALASALLFAAAALTGFPPAIDTLKETASSAEIWKMFEPKMPRLIGPEVVLIEAPEHTDLKTGEVGWKKDVRWDRFNHNISGVILMAIALVALLERLGHAAWGRQWPLMFIGFSMLIVLFANPDEWPLGPLGFVESAKQVEVVQHWLAALVMFGLGVFEWGARREPVTNPKLRFIFPTLCIVGGIVLLTHSHQIFELRREFLIQSTHVAMGLLAVIVGCCWWLELRLPRPQNRIAGLLGVGGMMLVGFILLFYVTPELGST